MNMTTQAPSDGFGPTPMDVATSLGLESGAWDGVLAALLVNLDAGLSVKRAASGCYVHSSARLASLLGRSPDELVGLTDVDLFGIDAAVLLREADATALMMGLPQGSEHRLPVNAAQPRRDFKVVCVPLPSAGSAVPEYLAHIWVDMTESLRRDAKLSMALMQLEQQQIANEALSRESQDVRQRQSGGGLYQRAQFDDQLRREVDLSTREHREFSLVSIAIDPPNEIEFDLGPAARPRVLEALGRLIRSNTRAMDASCRLGEDRFAILLSGVGLATAHARVESLRRQCATQIVVLDGHDFGFTVSMGVASFPHTAHTQDELFDASDKALGSAQRRGGNCVSLASIRFDALA
jgi:diguanylate cyclase (GGDEF)-like protein